MTKLITSILHRKTYPASINAVTNAIKSVPETRALSPTKIYCGIPTKLNLYPCLITAIHYMCISIISSLVGWCSGSNPFLREDNLCSDPQHLKEEREALLTVPVVWNRCLSKALGTESLATFYTYFLSSHLFLLTGSLIMPPTSKKLKGHIGFGLSVRASVCPFESLFDACHFLWTVNARVLKFHIWISHGKIADTRFFLVRVISRSGIMPLWKNQNEIWCMSYLMNRAC